MLETKERQLASSFSNMLLGVCLLENRLQLSLMRYFRTRSLASTLTPRVFASKQAKASAILASENSTLHKRAILPKFTEYLTHALNSFYQAVFSAPAKTDWERD